MSHSYCRNNSVIIIRKISNLEFISAIDNIHPQHLNNKVGMFLNKYSLNKEIQTTDYIDGKIIIYRFMLNAEYMASFKIQFTQEELKHAFVFGF